MRTSEFRLGIDIGRVIISRGEGANDTSFLHGSIERALQTPPYENMFEIVPQLVDRFSGPLSANMSETGTPWKFSVEGE